MGFQLYITTNTDTAEGPAVAGRNAWKSRPVYKNWRNVHLTPENPEIQRQLDHIRNKAHRTRDDRASHTPTANYPFQALEQKDPFLVSHANQERFDSRSMTPIARGMTNSVRDGKEASDERLDVNGKKFKTEGDDTRVALQHDQHRPGQAYFNDSFVPDEAQYYNDLEAHQEALSEMQEALAEMQATSNTKDVVISNLSRKMDMIIAHLQGQSSGFAEEIQRVVHVVSALPEEHSISVPADAISPPYGSIPTNPERLLKAAENMTQILKTSNAMLSSLDQTRFEMYAYLQNIGCQQVLPRSWDRH